MAETKYNWVDNPTVSGVAECNTDILNDCLMHLKYDNENPNILKTNQITNCLLEVPQRVKYELNDGVITLKAGSVFIVPYGNVDLRATYPVGSTFLNSKMKVVDTQFDKDPADNINKFFVWVELQSDVSRTLGSSTGSCYLQLGVNKADLSWYAINLSSSGTSDPAVTSGQWYDTTNNYNKGYNSGAFNQYLSFPFAIVTLASGKIAKIDQMFNGFGYIGKAYWSDKNIRFLVGDGRNNDGTLKNKEYTTAQFRTREMPITVNDTFYIVMSTANYLTYWDTKGIFIQEEQPEALTWKRWYKPSENQWYATDSGTTWFKIANPAVFLAQCSTTNGVINNFNSYQPFRAVDYNNKKEITSWGFPSSKYINLTLGATGSTYTAPANGWYYFCKAATGSNQSVSLKNQSNGLWSRLLSTANGNYITATIAAKQGDIIEAEYNAGGDVITFRFVYAEGDK